jgi:hypothetical protein
VSPEDAGEFGRYCQYRLRGEDEACTRLRMNLSETDARDYEAGYQQLQAGRAAA